MKRIFLVCFMMFLSSCITIYQQPISQESINSEQSPTSSATPYVSVIESFNQMLDAKIPECYEVGINKNTTCKIVKASCSYEPIIDGSPTICYDVPPPNELFTLIIWGEDWSSLNGKCLEVTGIKKIFNGKPAIETKSKSVTLCDF